MPRKRKTDQSKPFCVHIAVAGSSIEIARLGSEGQTMEFVKHLTIGYTVIDRTLEESDEE